MTNERLTITEDIQITGGHTCNLLNTSHLFKENIWYIIECEETYLLNSYFISICSQEVEVTQQGKKKFLFRINQSSTQDNVIKINVPLLSSVIIKKIKIYILGLLDYGFTTYLPNKPIQKNRFIENKKFKINPSPFSSSSFRWDGYFIFGSFSTSHQNLVFSEKTYFRLVCSSLSLESFQQLVAWIKRTYRNSSIEIGHELFFVFGADGVPPEMIVMENGDIIHFTP